MKLDNTGSFDEVFSNISTFRKKYPDYDKIGLSLCYDIKSDLKKIEEFINKEKLFVTKMAQIDSHNTTYYQQFTKEDFDRFLSKKESMIMLFLKHAKIID